MRRQHPLRQFGQHDHQPRSYISNGTTPTAASLIDIEVFGQNNTLTVGITSNPSTSPAFSPTT